MCSKLASYRGTGCDKLKETSGSWMQKRTQVLTLNIPRIGENVAKLLHRARGIEGGGGRIEWRSVG